MLCRGLPATPYEQPNLLPTSGSRKVLQHCRGLGGELERERGGIPLDISVAPFSLAFDFQPIVRSLTLWQMLSMKPWKLELY